MEEGQKAKDEFGRKGRGAAGARKNAVQSDTVGKNP